MSAPSMQFEHEILVPLPGRREDIEPATAYKSTWMLSSLGALRDRGHLDRYFAHLPREHHDEIRSLVAGSWVPLPLAREHYLACEALAFSQPERVALGRAVSDRAQGTLLSTAVRMAKAAGVTPWTILPQYDRLFHRGVQGGAVSVVKIAPKEARIDIVGLDLLSIPYFRAAFCGVLNGINGMFCRSSFVREIAHRRPDEASYRFQWA